MTKITFDLEKGIIEKYIYGGSIRDVAKEIGFSYGCVWNILNKNCIKRRTTSQILKGKPSPTKGKPRKPFTIEHCENISKSKKGQLKGLPPWNKGIPCSEEAKLKISKSTSGINNHNYGKRLYGEDNSNWKGGIHPIYQKIRNSPKYSEWRSMVFGRDLYTCQGCGIRGTYFEAHHIKRFNDIIRQYNITTLDEALLCEELWDISNGITLCKDCHKKITFCGETQIKICQKSKCNREK